jgi:hypothetical protein
MCIPTFFPDLFAPLSTIYSSELPQIRQVSIPMKLITHKKSQIVGPICPSDIFDLLMVTMDLSCRFLSRETLGRGEPFFPTQALGFWSQVVFPSPSSSSFF